MKPEILTDNMLVCFYTWTRWLNHATKVINEASDCTTGMQNQANDSRCREQTRYYIDTEVTCEKHNKPCSVLWLHVKM